jgi:glutamyl-tRNA reductase
MVIAMTIVCLSLSYRFVPAEVLEKLAVPAGELGEVLTRLHAVPGIDEAVLLSTCNRVEVYAAVSGPAGRVTGAVADLLAARGHVPADEIMRMARIRLNGAAAEHLFSVACGLDSMAVGEDQIVAQIKAATWTAAAARTTGPAVTGLVNAALRASKRARTQTAISTEGISLARAATPVIASTHAQIKQLADAELARLHDRLPDLSEHQRIEMAATVHRILGKILHRRTVRAREFSST